MIMSPQSAFSTNEASRSLPWSYVIVFSATGTISTPFMVFSYVDHFAIKKNGGIHLIFSNLVTYFARDYRNRSGRARLLFFSSFLSEYFKIWTSQILSFISWKVRSLGAHISAEGFFYKHTIHSIYRYYIYVFLIFRKQIKLWNSLPINWQPQSMKWQP